MELGLKNRIAFVTGASQGIGRAIAVAFACEGVHLALFGRDEARCEELVRELRALHEGLRLVAVKLDFEQPETIQPAIESAIAELGAIDILVNCAGGSYRGRLNDIPDDAWERRFRVKPFGLIRMTRATVPYLKRSNQARVINLSGIRGREPSAHAVMGGPINAATLSATKALANELGPLGITVNAVSPGPTQTRRWTELVALTARDHNISEDEAKKHLLRECPLGRVGLPEDVADLVVFLSSARAAMISGCAINVDGGRSHSI